MLRLERPLVVFDLETTSADPGSARIVSIGLVRMDTAGNITESVEHVVNPGIAIPPEATAVHGITDAMVTGAPTLSEIADEIVGFFADCDIAGFNVREFDLPVLRNELGRVGGGEVGVGAAIVDAMVIYHKYERRTLSAAVKLYLEREHEDAHGALADAQATAEVLLAQVRRYNLPGTVSDLAREGSRRQPDFVDARGKIRWTGGEATFTFGKVSGRTLRDVAENDRGYLEWILGKDFEDDLKAIIRDALDGRFPVAGG